MPLFFHELKQNKISLLVWTLVLTFMLGVTVFIYPEMKDQMNQFGDMFSEMGAFSAAFGMEELNFGEFSGYFAIECGNTLGLGGALFAAILGIGALSKEEKGRTAEFLLSHPISRGKVVLEKFFGMLIQLLFLNVVVMSVSGFGILAIGEKIAFSRYLLLFIAFFLLQFVIFSVTFGISSFLRTSGIGIGIGIAMIAYFFNILSNLLEELEFLKFITPFSFADGASILTDGELSISYLFVSLAIAFVFILFSFLHYPKKDIY